MKDLTPAQWLLGCLMLIGFVVICGTIAYVTGYGLVMGALDAVEQKHNNNPAFSWLVVVRELVEMVRNP